MALQPPVSSALPTYALCLVSSSESNEVWKMLRMSLFMSLFSAEGACAPSLSLGIHLPCLPVYLQGPTQCPLLRTPVTLSSYHISSLLCRQFIKCRAAPAYYREGRHFPHQDPAPASQCCPCYTKVAQEVPAASQDLWIS